MTSQQEIPLNLIDGTHYPSQPTLDLLQSIGGRDRLLEVTTLFYPKMFRDKHLQQFVESTSDPHPERLADWIAEKMSGHKYWSSQLHQRPDDQPYDRQSAHHKAWYSFRRDQDKTGRRFKLDDAVTWMRLFFWSIRESGLSDTPFWGWIMKFISHFIRIYENTASHHVLEAAEWSADNDNLIRYEQNDWLMTDVPTH
jgi:hypothetical protein